MGKKQLTLVSKIILSFLAVDDLVRPFFNIHEFRRRALYGTSYKSYKDTIYRLHKKGWIRFVDKDGQRLLKLTEKGELESLLAKLIYPSENLKWDGKWRILLFDIPIETNFLRDRLRRLIKHQGFKMLQASVWVNPYPLSREAIRYLQKTKLIEFIRIIKVEEMDNDKDLRKLFNV